LSEKENNLLSIDSLKTLFPTLKTRHRSLLEILNNWRAAQSSQQGEKPRILYQSTEIRRDKLALVLPCLQASAGLVTPVFAFPVTDQKQSFLSLFGGYTRMNLHLSAEEFARQIRLHNTSISFPPESLFPFFRKNSESEKAPRLSFLNKLGLFLLLACPEIVVFDIKTGQTDRNKSELEGQEFLLSLKNLCDFLNVSSSFLLSDYSQPLGQAIGGILEVKETLDVLQGKGPADLFKLTLELSSEALRLSSPFSHRTEIKGNLKKLILSGRPLDFLVKTVRGQGGATDILDKAYTLSEKMIKVPVPSARSGYIHKLSWTKIRNMQRRMAAYHRDSGFLIIKKTGETVNKGDVLGSVYLPSPSKHAGLKDLFQEIFFIEETPLPFRPFIRRFP
jgi:hypothetical protein